MTAVAEPNPRRMHGSVEHRVSRIRRPTSTARFGSSRREGHDASGFYERFVAPEISDDSTVVRPSRLDVIYTCDSRHMDVVESNSVALVVTSPPYFAGKQYERDLGVGGVPATYIEYLRLLEGVFAECRRVLEPGGRIAVNVANLGRRPYRSLAADVIQILQDLGLLLRGEIVWWKGRAAGGSCAWGSFQHPSNPVLRDVTERIVIASKGRFDRAIGPGERARLGLPARRTVTRDEFLDATTDLWELAPERASRVGHPAPFPVVLPRRLIELYTYEEDVVLDPFMGSGSTALAAVETRRRYIGFETDESYVDRANERLRTAVPGSALRRPTGGFAAVSDSVSEGRSAKEVAATLLTAAGFGDIHAGVRIPRAGVELSFAAKDRRGATWYFDLAGSFSISESSLRRSDVLWRAIGKASVVHSVGCREPLVLLATDLPPAQSAAARSLKSITGPGRALMDVIDLLEPRDQSRLQSLASDDAPLEICPPRSDRPAAEPPNQAGSRPLH